MESGSGIFMRVTGCGRLAFAAAMLPVLLSCAQAPPYVAPMATPKPVVSYVNVPVSISLQTLEKAIDADLRRAVTVEPFDAPLNGGSAPPSCGVDAGYAIERGPVQVAGADAGVVSTLDLDYWLKGRKQVPCPGAEMVASCGTDGEAPRTARLVFDSEITIRPDLTTLVKTTPRPVTAGSRCVLNPVGLDITDALVQAFDAKLREMTPALDQRLSASLDLQSRMRAAWERMSEPREIQANVWLSWNPEGIGVMPVAVSGDALTTGLQLRVRPVVTAGAKPAAATKPLPLAYSASPDDSFQLQLPIHVEQSFMQARLAEVLELDKGGMPLSAGNFTTRIVGADVTGEGTQVQIRLTFAGDLSGTALLVGTPIYDAPTRTLSFPDLDYTLDSDQFLLSSAAYLGHGMVRDRLRQQFTLPLGDRIDQLKGGLEALLNRRNGNVQLHGTVEDLKLLGVSRPSEASVFTVFLSARGKVAADLVAAEPK